MKKKLINYFILCIWILLPNIIVYAHPGRTDSNGCHTCKTNCSKWGLRYGQYHCHNGVNSNTDSNSNQINNSNSIHISSSINTLSSLMIDNENIPINSEMSYKTTNSNPNISAKLTDNKSTINIDKIENLHAGDNYINITVTAENGLKRQYKLNIYLLNNDATLKNIKINNNEIKISDDINYITTDNEINIIANATDKNAHVVYDDNYKLEIGNNLIIIKVIAENNINSKEYILNVERKLLLSDNTNVSISVNDKQVIFKDYYSETIYLNSNVKKIIINPQLEDEKATIDLNYDQEINSGSKTIKFKVISESGIEQEYVLSIYKYSKLEEILSSFVIIAISLGLIFGIYKLFHSIKLKWHK